LAHVSKQKALLTGAAGILVIAGVIALSVHDSHHPRSDPAPKSHPLVKGHPAGSSKTTTSLSATGTSSPTSASTVPYAASGTDWVISGSDTLYISTNGATYHEVNPPPISKGTQLVSAVVSGSTVIAYDYNPELLLGQPIDLDLSHDGGVTWSVEHVAVYGTPTNIHFVVAHGSVIGMMVDQIAPGADATGGEWFQTSNDGDTWISLSPNPISNTPQGGPVTLVGSDLWVLGGGQGYDQLWLSTNNGASWSQVHFPGESLDDIPSHGCQDVVYPSIAGQLSSGATVLVTAKVPNGNCTSNYLDVTAYATTNQGATWTAFGSFTTTQVGVYTGLLPKYVTVQGNSVWLATVPNQFVTNPPASPPQFVHITTSGAHSLVSLSIAPIHDSGTESITVNANGQLQVTLVHFPPGSERTAPAVISRRYISTNDGETWQPLAMHFLRNGSPIAKKS
jgi:hypothetical protein